MRVFGVAGWKNSGKTHLMVRLITEITDRGYTVSTIKHAHHLLELNTRDDNGRMHIQPKADAAILASETRWSHVRQSDERIDYPLSDLLARLRPVDLVLVEGFKLGDHPKIEAFRTVNRRELLAGRDATIVAIASDQVPLSTGRPVFDLDDTTGIADFILGHVGLN